jgi:hypothetical protein
MSGVFAAVATAVGATAATAATAGTIGTAIGAVATVGSAVAGGIMSAEQGKQQSDAAKKGLQIQQQAALQASKSADITAIQQDKAITDAMNKQANLPAIMASTQKGNAGGGGGTLLTGAGGVNPGSLTLGKSTLLGS